MASLSLSLLSLSLSLSLFVSLSVPPSLSLSLSLSLRSFGSLCSYMYMYCCKYWDPSAHLSVPCYNDVTVGTSLLVALISVCFRVLCCMH